MWRSRWRCVIKPAYSVSFLLSINIFVWRNVLYFLDAPRILMQKATCFGWTRQPSSGFTFRKYIKRKLYICIKYYLRITVSSSKLLRCSNVNTYPIWNLFSPCVCGLCRWYFRGICLLPEDRGYSFPRNIGNTSHSPHDAETKTGSTFPMKRSNICCCCCYCCCWCCCCCCINPETAGLIHLEWSTDGPHAIWQLTDRSRNKGLTLSSAVMMTSNPLLRSHI